MSRSRHRTLSQEQFRAQDPEYVEAVQGMRRSSATRPHGSLKGRNRQNERRKAVDKSMKED